MANSERNPAEITRLAMTQEYKSFEALLDNDQEAIATFFLPSREVRIRVGMIGSTDSGLINVFGEDESGKPVDLFMHYSAVCYLLEAASSDQPRRIGFVPSSTQAGGQ